ncbi:glutathione hydrolase 3-like [Impatiens glandulifera]|uniref:glutathione hydrolase 3-like n=1 Tax=Impatiens glandulifera TaxID=253017 RepID=UPI001FB1662A|nr:glutathione hydrolase 3-like [Impatiens glandulifera]
MMENHSLESSLLGGDDHARRRRWTKAILYFSLFIILAFLRYTGSGGKIRVGNAHNVHRQIAGADIVESSKGVVAADDGRCSEIGASMLRKGGHAVDAAVATALCVGVVNPMASGIGGGAFMIVHSTSTNQTVAFDMRETAPLAASEDMYSNDLNTKYEGALSMGVPGELAGLHEAWLTFGRLPWNDLFKPAIKLAKEGFIVEPYLALSIFNSGESILSDPGLRSVFAPNGRLLQAGDTCHNIELGRTLEAIANNGPKIFYIGDIGKKLVKDVRNAGGILTFEDLRDYRVVVTDPISVNTMGYTILGMPPPSSGTVALSLVLNILDSYESLNAAKGAIGLHRLIESLKHTLAVRMNLGDPKFVDINNTISNMLSHSFAKQLQQKIFDNTTFPSDYYLPRWSQLDDHGTSHFCIVDGDRNAVSMTTTVNYPFGAKILSQSTGIILNNEMGDFSVPTEIGDQLPPAPTNFIKPNKRPLSSMTPIVVLKNDQLVAVIGGSGGLYILEAVIQVFLNYFAMGMDPLAAVQNPRVYHKLIPNTVLYENWTVIDGDHIELAEERKKFLEERGHQMEAKKGGAICQLIVQTITDDYDDVNQMGRKYGKPSSNDKRFAHGVLTAVSDPRKDGRPAAV